MAIDEAKLLTVFEAAVDRAEVECPEALRQAKEHFASAMREFFDVLLPYVPEADRQPLIETVAGILASIQRRAS